MQTLKVNELFANIVLYFVISLPPAQLAIAQQAMRLISVFSILFINYIKTHYLFFKTY